MIYCVGSTQSINTSSSVRCMLSRWTELFTTFSFFIDLLHTHILSVKMICDSLLSLEFLPLISAFLFVFFQTNYVVLLCTHKSSKTKQLKPQYAFCKIEFQNSMKKKLFEIWIRFQPKMKRKIKQQKSNRSVETAYTCMAQEHCAKHLSFFGIEF